MTKQTADTITSNERKVISYMLTEAVDAVCASSVEEARDNYCAPCDPRELAENIGVSMQQIRGVIASLIKKELIEHEVDGAIQPLSQLWLSDRAFQEYAHLVEGMEE